MIYLYFGKAHPFRVPPCPGHETVVRQYIDGAWIFVAVAEGVRIPLDYVKHPVANTELASQVTPIATKEQSGHCLGAAGINTRPPLTTRARFEHG
jgi:hypothetical protein